MYEQTLVNIIDDHIKPHVLKRMNKGKKWKYGYNEAHDIVVISKNGQIGEIYEIQNLKIALPTEFDVVKLKITNGSTLNTQKSYLGLKVFLIGTRLQMSLRINGLTT